MTVQVAGETLGNETESSLEKIALITKYQKSYVANSLRRMAKKSTCNVSPSLKK
jgi:hypothetical protein